MTGPAKDRTCNPFSCNRVRVAIGAAAIAGLLIGLVAGGSQADAHEPTLVFVNAADEPVVNLYISEPKDDNWGASHLTEDLQPGDGVAITADGNRNRCSYDVMAEFAYYAEEATWYETNLCEGQYFVIRPPD